MTFEKSIKFGKGVYHDIGNIFAYRTENIYFTSLNV